MICPLCKKKQAITANACGSCLLLVSHEEQAMYQCLIDQMFETAPEVLICDTNTLVHLVIRSLPYTTDFIVQHIFELRIVIAGLLEQTIDHIIIDVEEVNQYEHAA